MLGNSTLLARCQGYVYLQAGFHSNFMGTFPRISETSVLITCPKALGCMRFSDKNDVLQFSELTFGNNWTPQTEITNNRFR